MHLQSMNNTTVELLVLMDCKTYMGGGGGGGEREGGEVPF